MMMSTRSNALESWSSLLTLLLLLFISCCCFVVVDAAAATNDTKNTTTKSLLKIIKPTATTTSTSWNLQQQQQQITTSSQQQNHHHHLVGEVSAVYELLDRILNHHKHFFVLKIDNNNYLSSLLDNNNNNRNSNNNEDDDEDEDNNKNNNDDDKRLYFRLEDYYYDDDDDDERNDAITDSSSDDDDDEEEDSNNKILITASTASELTAGIGYYLWNYCNITIGWKRGGGSSNINKLLPLKWPKIGHKNNGITKYRAVPWSYFMNVCTHSYSLVWYDKKDWEYYIDWLSLNGINNIVALTGQEQIQYDTFRQLGLQDEDIRTWFNGPAFLTWSRGQNEYGNNIAGPLPKSWMKQQYELQKNFILPRLRSLGIIGQLPGFQGNVPIQIKTLYKDNNITQQGQTGWIDSLDPLFGKIADLYMKNLLDAFGTDHWYQLDGYFNGGTAPWMSSRRNTTMISTHSSRKRSNYSNSTGSNQRHNDDDDTSYNTISSLLPSSSSSSTSHDKNWFLRGKAAYEGLNRTDPNAIWSFQGFSLIFWDDTQEKANAIKGFIDAVPSNKFVILDMSYSGLGEWTKWNNSSFFGTPFIWTALHDFGGTDGIKGDIRRLNHIPFDLLNGRTSVVGIGGTPEGIDQNPAYYEFLFGSTFRSNPIQDLEDFMGQRSIKRYGLKSHNDDSHDSSTAAYHASKAWSLLMGSLYSNDINVQDHTGIAHFNPRGSVLFFESDRHTPKPILCQVFHAWEHLLLAAQEAEKGSSHVTFSNNKPFQYDLVNLGREILAQLSTPAALNFTNATGRESLDPAELLSTGKFYTDLLNDTDTLVATDKAFLLGPWIESAKKWGSDSNYNTYDDCFSSMLNNRDCVHFYEWNARCQITTWNPTPKDSPSIPGGPIDYAAKHWSGLIKDYYVRRVGIILVRALQDQSSGNPLNTTVVDRLLADHAYKWTTSRNHYPTTISGNALKVSQTMYHKYKHWFNTCQTGGEDDEGNYELNEKMINVDLM